MLMPSEQIEIFDYIIPLRSNKKQFRKIFLKISQEIIKFRLLLYL